MSADGDGAPAHETVIIVRRGGDHEDGHHGGAWKIAFADLMTAMMAFFLVMWLLNVSDKEKITQIATYFNPMKLNSKRPTSKGVQENNDVPKAERSEKVGAANKQNVEHSVESEKGKKAGVKSGGDGDKKKGSEVRSEEELFNDPYGLLAKLALTASEGQKKGGGSATRGDQQGGDVYGNPFQPFSEREMQETMDPAEPPSIGLDEPAPLRPTPQAEAVPAAPGEAWPDSAVPPSAALTAPQAEAEARIPPPSQDPEVAKIEKAKVEARKLEKEILGSLAKLSVEDRPTIEVTRTDEGLLISLTDDFRFGMFGSSSAEPKAELVVVMEKIGKILSERQGGLVVRGHTDSRPFRNPGNNNWRLSSARAQMAYFMLVRGGVDEARFERIEGHADRALRVQSDPMAAQNRRIEILLKVPNV